MDRTNRIALGIGSTLVLGAAGAGIASGAKTDSTQPAGSGGGPPGAAAMAAYLGLTSDRASAPISRAERRSLRIASRAGKPHGPSWRRRWSPTRPRTSTRESRPCKLT